MSRRERGAASIVMLAVLVMGVVLSMGAARLGNAIDGRARADSAADAAALAAADWLALGEGPEAARAAARQTAASNGARLISCACSGTVAEVVVEVDLPALAGIGGPARSHAKAEVRPECVVARPDC
jgi:secretion/DNA translocation related TadE-like protein